MSVTGALTARVVHARHEFTVDVHLDVRPGETLALMGPSGAGKTTVLDALSGLVRLDAGRIVLDGHTLADPAKRIHVAPSARRIGRLSQDSGLFPHLTVIDNIAFAVRARGARRDTARHEAHEWLERLGLETLGSRRPDLLSGGQIKRIALVRALAAQPSLLLIDEPFVSLDVEAAADMRALLAEQLREYPTSVVLVSHDPRDALSLASRMIILERGAITHQGTCRGVLANPVTRFARALAGAGQPGAGQPEAVTASEASVPLAE